MSRIPKIVVAVVVTVLVVAGAVVVYRETDLLTGSLVVLCGLLIIALFARRVAVREERAGMAEWEEEALASAAAADDLFGDWTVTSPRDARGGGAGATATHEVPSAPVSAEADPVEVPEPADPSVAVSRPIRSEEAPAATESIVARLFSPEPGDGNAVQPEVDDDRPETADRTPALAGVGPASSAAVGASAEAHRASPIDWTGQGGRVDERVQTSDDILRASEATALPLAGAAGGSELARLLAKVEARLRDYD